jgi:PKD repeat protein
MKKLLAILAIAFLLVICPTDILSKVEVGEEVLESYDTPHPYPGEKGVVWEKEFHWPGAGYIAIHFSKFDLANSDYVEISTPGGQFSYSFKDKGKKIKGGTASISEFWATHVPGDTAIVKLHSKNQKSAFGFTIDKWARGYEKDYIEAAMGNLQEDRLETIESLCSSDDKEWAKCYLGTTMYDKAKAVSRLLINGTSACTGWLLGNQGHLMTNNHCIESSSDANNTDFEFMAEGATCATSCASWGACPGTIEASSSTLIKTSTSLDYSLVLLPTNISTTYGYMQLRDTLPTIGERMYLPQHPSAYGKMIAVNSDEDGGYAKVYSTDEAPCMGGPGDIGYYADTAGGSSGSPVLGYSDHLVIALHHCAACPNRGVPIPSIITDLGANLPNDAVGGAVINPPVADFTSNTTNVTVGGTVNFTDLSTNNPDNWSWTFNGGTPSSSTDQNPNITYNAVGTYTVSLTATNAAGNDIETKTNYITVTAPQPPVADFSANATTIEAGQSVAFSDLTTNGPTSWSWTFNGGTPSSSTAQNPTITYNTVGTYTVALTATNAVGNDTETKVDYITVIEPTVTYCSSEGNDYSYEWISNVTVGTMNNTSGATGYTDFTSITCNLTAGNSVNISLTPDFSSSTYTEYWKIWIDYNKDGDFTDTGEEVYASGGSSTTVTGSFTVAAGASGVTRMRVTMKYAGTPTSCETFTYGEVEDYTVNITAGTINPPVAAFSGSPTTIDEGQTVNFTDSSTNNPTSWSWAFEGGTPATSTAQNPTVTYNTAGNYNVSLTVTNSAGNDIETKTNYITVNVSTITYCTSQGNNSSYEWISNVTVGTMNNTSGAAGYTDFTSITCNLTAGNSVNVSLTPDFSSTLYTEYWKIWIDYNKDGDFDDAGEEVFSGGGSQSTVTGSFTVPTSAAGQVTRMRVSMKWNAWQTSSCESFSYGEVEDYTVNIQ